MTEHRLRVLIVDDSAIVRRGIRALLETSPDMEVVGEAGDGDRALALAEQSAPDLVLLDVQMPGRDGLSVVAALAARARVLMLTFSDSRDVIHAAMAAGATGYVVHGTFDADSLVSTVRNVASGLSVFSGPALDAMRLGPRAEEPAAPPQQRGAEWGMSARQVEVMELIAAGRSNREIARELFLSEKTVKNHINQIFAKLGAETRSLSIATWLGTAQPTGSGVGPGVGPTALGARLRHP